MIRVSACSDSGAGMLSPMAVGHSHVRAAERTAAGTFSASAHRRAVGAGIR
jgi:hypothetical protein